MSVSRNTAYNMVGAVIPLALSFFTVPFYLKLIGQDRYGVLGIAWLLLGYFGLFDLGLGRATQFRIASLRDAEPQARADTFWAALLVNVSMGLIGGAILWLCAGLFFGHVLKVKEALRPEIMQAVPLLAFSVPVATLTGVLTGALQGSERFLETNAISVGSTVLFQLAPLSLAWAVGPYLPWLLCAALAARSLAVITLGSRCYVRFARGRRVRLVRSEIPLLVRFGGWVTVTAAVGPFLTITDRFMIGAIKGAAAAGIYSIPQVLTGRIAFLPASLTNALFPKLAIATAAEQDALVEKATRALLVILTVPVLGGVFILGPFLDVWVGRSVSAQAATAGRVLLIAFWANGFSLIPFNRLQAMNRPSLISKGLVAEVFPYLLVLWLGLQYLGFLGAALAFCARCVSDYLWLTWFAGRKYPCWGTHLACFLVISAGALAATMWPITNPLWWVAGGGLGLVLLALIWKFLPHDRVAQIIDMAPGLRSLLAAGK